MKQDLKDSLITALFVVTLLTGIATPFLWLAMSMVDGGGGNGIRYNFLSLVPLAVLTLTWITIKVVRKKKHGSN
jgi:hypothetical protein